MLEADAALQETRCAPRCETFTGAMASSGMETSDSSQKPTDAHTQTHAHTRRHIHVLPPVIMIRDDFLDSGKGSYSEMKI